MQRTNPRANAYHTGRTAQVLKQYIPIILDPEAARFADRRKAALAGYLRGELTNRELECMQLYFVEGYSMETISKLLAISVSAISRNIKRGRERIQRVLGLGGELLGQDFIFS